MSTANPCLQPEVELQRMDEGAAAVENEIEPQDAPAPLLQNLAQA
jgi:hypothetical protein